MTLHRSLCVSRGGGGGGGVVEESEEIIQLILINDPLSMVLDAI